MHVCIEVVLCIFGLIEHCFVQVLKLKLANSTESELKQLQSSLRDTKDGVAADLQKNVFKKCVYSQANLIHAILIEYHSSYAEFVHISKEIGTLENEMLELKESLSEWKSMPSLLHIDDSASAAGPFLLTWSTATTNGVPRPPA